MLITKVKEPFNLSDGTIKSEKLYLNIQRIDFNFISQKIVPYLTKGWIEVIETIVEEIDPVTGEPYDVIVLSNKYNALETAPTPYNDEEIKTMLDANGIVFNADGDNLLLGDMVENATTILFSIITESPQDYFGLSGDKWEIPTV